MAPWRKTLQNFLDHPIYDGTISMICVLNILALFVNDYENTYGHAKHYGSGFVISEFILNFLYTFEVFFQLFVWGPRHCWRYRHNMKLEFIYVILNFALFILYVTDNYRYDSLIRFLSMIILLRIVKLFTVLMELDQFKLIIDTIQSLFRPFYAILGVMFIVYYVFSQIGDRAFGGIVQNNDIRILSQSDFPQTYTLMNMNDMLSSFITLFAIMVVNNFQVVVQVYTFLTGTNYSRWFFIIFYLLSVVMLIDLVVALVLNMYDQIAELNQQKKEELIEN